MRILIVAVVVTGTPASVIVINVEGRAVVGGRTAAGSIIAIVVVGIHRHRHNIGGTWKPCEDGGDVIEVNHRRRKTTRMTQLAKNLSISGDTQVGQTEDDELRLEQVESPQEVEGSEKKNER